MTVELNPVLWGRLGVDVLAGYLKGEKYKQQVFIKHVIIDKTKGYIVTNNHVIKDADMVSVEHCTVVPHSVDFSKLNPGFVAIK